MSARDRRDRLHDRQEDAGEGLGPDRLNPPRHERAEIALQPEFEAPSGGVAPDRLCGDQEHRQKPVLGGCGVERDADQVPARPVLDEDVPVGLDQERPNDAGHMRGIKRLQGDSVGRGHANLRRFHAGIAGR